MPETSIVIKAEDRYSEAINKMAANTKRFNKDVETMEYGLLKLSNNKATLRMDLSQAQKELKAAEKQFAKTGAEADGLALQLKQANYDNIKRNLDSVTKAARDTEHQIRKMNEETQEIRAVSGSGGIGAGIKNSLNELISLGASDMIGKSVQTIFDAAASSTFGDAGGRIISDTVSSAISGFARGGVKGAIVAGATGLISGIAQNEAAKDDAYKNWYGGLYETASASIDASLQSGIGIAGTRESDLLSFTALLGGDRRAAGSFQNALIGVGRTPPFSYDMAAGFAKDMLGLGLTEDEALSRINALGNAAATLGLSETNVSSIVSLLESSQLSGKIEGRVLKSLSKLGINVYSALAEAFEVDESEVEGLLSQMGADKGVAAIYAYMGKLVSDTTGSYANTYEGRVSAVQSYDDDFNSRMGTGYETERKKGLLDEQLWKSGELGAEYGKAMEAVGAGRAAMENLASKYNEEALGAVMLNKETTLDWSDEVLAELAELSVKYQEAKAEYEAGNKEAGAKVEAYLEEAQALAEAEYDSCEAVRTVADVEKDLISAINANTSALGGWRAEYMQEQALSKGRLASAFEEGSVLGTFGFLGLSPEKIPGFATGLERVPYDNFPALLHEGERVLTAAEARSYNGGSPVTVTGNTFVVRQDSDIDAIAAAISEKIRMARLAGVT